MANSPPRLPIVEWSVDDLLDDLCVELRQVGCRDYQLPKAERILPNIREVEALHAELERRGADWRARIEALSAQTQWLMNDLLEDCLAFPGRLPFVKELDGIRRTLRCRLCRKAERPVDAKLFWFCQRCMRRVAESIQQRKPLAGMIVFRSYSPECRCTHADADTVLAAEAWTDQEILKGCGERCVVEELERRKGMTEQGGLT